MPNTIPDIRTFRGGALRASVDKALPLLVSVAVHGGLLILGFLTYQSVKVILRPQEQTNVPETPMLLEQVSSENFNQGASDAVRPSGWELNPAGLPSPMGRARDEEFIASTSDTRHTMVEQSPSADPLNRFNASNFGSTFGLGSDRDGTRATPFGPGSGQRGVPNIFSPKAVRSPQSVAFLCDASGSMLGKFDTLKRELDKAIVSLRPVQAFDVIFFGDNRSNSLGRNLLMATPGNKVRATSFLESITPRGPTDPLPALELAFQQRPQLIFVLTDGDFPDNVAVLKRIQSLNRLKSVRINTIAFVGEADNDTGFISLLKQIAGENSGTYKRVVASELP